MNKVARFLKGAFEEGVIAVEAYDALLEYQQDQKNRFSVISLISYFGSFCVFLGIVLIISHNWFKVSPFLKITIFNIVLFSFYFLANILQKKYIKIAESLRFLASVAVLAGIALISQIYNLHYDYKKGILAWLILITPLSFVTRQKSLYILSFIVFYYWFFVASIEFAKDLGYVIILYATNMLFFAKLFAKNIPQINTYFSLFGNLILLSFLYIIGFDVSLKEEFTVNPYIIILLICNLCFLAKKLLEKKNRFFAINIILILCAASLQLFYPSFLGQVFAWLVWLHISIFSIFRGYAEKENKYISLGIWGVFVFIITRFLDLIWDYLTGGISYIIFGVILILIAIQTEKYRKKICLKKD